MKKIKTLFQLLMLNYKIYKLNKKKNIIFKEIGILVYEFYYINKSLLEDEEIEALISEIKDIEVEVDTLERLIEKLKNNSSEEKEEISNELLLGEDNNEHRREDKESS